MQSTSLRVLKVYMWFIALFHLVVGLAVNVSPGMTRSIAAAYGATVDWTPQFVYILHPLGAFMIALGLMAIAAARDPHRYEWVVLGFVALFAIRALHRLVFADVLSSAFSIAPSRNTLNMVIFAVQAILVFALWRASRPRAGASNA
jgi:hypothetical protein